MIKANGNSLLKFGLVGMMILALVFLSNCWLTGNTSGDLPPVAGLAAGAGGEGDGENDEHGVTQTCNGTVSCTVSASSPAFSTVTAATASCGGCHDVGGSASGRWTRTSHASTVAKICKGDAANSTLSRVLAAGGTMASYDGGAGNGTAKAAIDAWINGCAAQ